MAILFEGGLAFVACVIGVFMTTPPWQRFAWRWVDIAWGLLATVPLIIGLFLMRRVERGPLGRLNQVVDSLVAPLFGRCSMLELFIISAIAGVGEELLFRGVVQPLLIAVLNAVAGVIIASIIFGLLHAITASYAVVATAVGIYFGWLALATGNLLPPIIAHGLYDFLALLYLVRGGLVGRSSSAAISE